MLGVMSSKFFVKISMFGRISLSLDCRVGDLEFLRILVEVSFCLSEVNVPDAVVWV